MASGQPINLSYTTPSAFQVSTAPTYRPNYLGGDMYSPERSVQNYFNKASVVAPNAQNPNDPSRPFGNLGRNVARTKALYNFDGGAHKDFPLPREDTRIEFRAEFFNLFNKTNLGAASSNVSSNNFGTITGLSSPARQIQFALKLVF
jgi:hypothetical protein